ncbi:MAG: alpha-ribazole phosphatase [Bacteroidetes bacterium RIFCSPLOWO2_12_FULL_35_15]|nr:MAG: alpha-ribazole phosphatase [Bacteroidetes bacterium RIFCSPLOWO2_12_FULL_35_15]
MEIHFVRHIETSAEKGICYGQLDVGIPDDYKAHHEQIINSLENNYDLVFSSPLKRCKLLAEQISENVNFDDRLMEISFGDWEGKKWDDINQMDLSNWMENYITIAPPRGESLIDLVDRVSAFLNELKKQNFTKVLIITHAGIIRCAMNVLNSVPLEKIMFENVEYGEIIKFKSY